MVCGFACALTAARFKRRKVYLICVCCLLSIYVGWTISMERYLTTKAQAAAVMTIVFIFVYSPAYSLGYNALTYSKSLNPFFPTIFTNIASSISCRNIPIRRTISRNRMVSILRERSGIFRHVCQSHRSGKNCLEMAFGVLRMACIRDLLHLFLVP